MLFPIKPGKCKTKTKYTSTKKFRQRSLKISWKDSHNFYDYFSKIKHRGTERRKS